METVAEILNGQGFIDIHCHLLPGLDDGPANEAEALAMARILCSTGFSQVYCTPHMLQGAYYNPPPRVRAAVAKLQATLDGAQVPLKLHPSTEYYLDEYLPTYLEEPLTVGDSFLLVEASNQADPDFLLDAIYQIIRKGLTPILAHPERCNILEPDKETANRLREMGCLFQQNIGSFAGIYGERAHQRAVRYLERQFCYRIATDAHCPSGLDRRLLRGTEIIQEIVGIKETERLFGALS